MTAQVFEMHNVGALGDAMSSYGGAGTVEMRAVVEPLKEAGIPCCVVGTHALGYYGAGRVPIYWELCVPSDHLSSAASLFKSAPLSSKYEPWPVNAPVLSSIVHTFPRFHLKGVHFLFFLVSSRDWPHISFSPTDLELSAMCLPYPRLNLLAQCLLDTQRWVDLEDLVDGMNLSEEWGEQNLDLDREYSLQYAEWKNSRIRESIPRTEYSDLMELNENPTSLREIWIEIVRTKERRMGVELQPRDQYLTRFWPVGARDPRLRERYTY